MTSAPAIGFEYRPSRWLFVAPTLVALLGCAAVAASGLPFYAQAASIALVACLWFGTVRRQSAAISAVAWSPASGWSVHGEQGFDDPALLLSHRILGPFVLLRLASPHFGKMALWLGPDNSDADIRRRLRMRLAVLRADPAGMGA
jgi:toxin CptA